jgi:glucose-1-phosphate cytidylyltransferase
MKTVILAGGLGTRLSEFTDVLPKPMVEIGGLPVLWHIMKIYAHHGFGEFVVALGYKGEVIKRFFLDRNTLAGNITLDTRTGAVSRTEPEADDWVVHLRETGPKSNTGGRVWRVHPVVGDETFMMTYGDGVSDLDIGQLLQFHRSHGKLLTLTAVRPPARYGTLDLDGSRIARFHEKAKAYEAWINGGFFVMEPEVFGYLGSDDDDFEKDILPKVAADGELMAFFHEGFWQSMDTVRDVRLLNSLWDSGAPPWKLW